ncbi:MAG: hypothetical protein U0520_01340 [Candidatus Saccharimonadales bacterium]
MKTTISLKQLRTDFPAVIEAVANGVTFTVIKRSKPVFNIEPVKDAVWDLDFTEISERGVPVADLITALQKLQDHENGRQSN